MKHPGKIVITDNKVKLEYHELKEPTKEMFKCYSTLIQEKAYNRALKEYEASKRVIEVSNAEKYICCNMACIKLEGKFREFVHNNTLCEAEVENNVATIIKIN